MSSKPKLKPCPFCGGEAQLLRISKLPNGVEEWFVSCGSDSCDLYPHSTIPYASAEIAAAAWNRRAVGTPSDAAAMREACRLANEEGDDTLCEATKCPWYGEPAGCNHPTGYREDAPYGNAAAMREALKMFVDAYSTTSYTLCIENLRPAFQKAKAALAAPARECDRFDDDLQADALHEAFVKHCNDCDCPMGCIHRMEMKGLLDVRCASILKCFARFALSEATPKEGGEK